MQFLIDECLSPVLADMAVRAGYPLSAHVTRRGMESWQDHRLMAAILAEDWTFVTRNADDFRPRPGSRRLSPCYLGVPIHAGLVCLNLPVGARRQDQVDFFAAALATAESLGDLIDTVIEIDPLPGRPEQLKVSHYQFP